MTMTTKTTDNVRYAHELHWSNSDWDEIDGVNVEQNQHGLLKLTFSDLALLYRYDCINVTYYEDYQNAEGHAEIRAYWFTGSPNSVIFEACLKYQNLVKSAA